MGASGEVGENSGNALPLKTCGNRFRCRLGQQFSQVAQCPAGPCFVA